MLRTAIAASLAAAALSGTAAQAHTIDFVGFSDGSVTFRDDSFTGRTKPPVNAVGVGRFELELDGTDRFLAFCLDILETFADGDFSKSGDGSTVGLGTSQQDSLQGLFTNHYDKITDRVTSAAFQLAAWEIVYEDSDSFGLDLDTGGFKVEGLGYGSTAAENARQGAIDTANTWLGDLAFTSPGYVLTYWDPDPDNRVAQEVVSASPVPLPAAGWMLLAGLGGLAAMRSRRKTAA